MRTRLIGRFAFLVLGGLAGAVTMSLTKGQDPPRLPPEIGSPAGKAPTYTPPNQVKQANANTTGTPIRPAATPAGKPRAAVYAWKTPSR